jgi:hypothetical protein
MPLHHAVLALLADKPAHGYELKNSFEQAVGDQWGGLSASPGRTPNPLICGNSRSLRCPGWPPVREG